MNFTTAVTVPCDDIDNSGGGTSGDGFVNLPTCASWGQQEDEVDDDGDDLCESASGGRERHPLQVQLRGLQLDDPGPAPGLQRPPDGLQPGQYPGRSVDDLHGTDAEQFDLHAR